MARIKIRGHYGNCITRDEYECPHCSCDYVDEADTLRARSAALLAALEDVKTFLSVRDALGDEQWIDLEQRVQTAIEAEGE